MAEKKDLIRLFTRIHNRYDFLNHALSLNLDKRWRKSLVDQVKSLPLKKILDVCTGTCDLAIAFAKRYPEVEVMGIDIAGEMLKIGSQKIMKAGLNGRILLQQSDLFYLPFKDGVFDAVSIGFGFRNLQEKDRGTREMARVLKKDGLLLILELTLPKNPFLKMMHLFYLKNILPTIGGLVSGSKDSYCYLSSSITGFPEDEEILRLLKTEHLRDVHHKSLSGGIATIFVGKK